MQRTLLLLFAMMHQHETLVAKAKGYAGYSGPEWRFARRYVRVFEPVLALERRRLAGEAISEAERASVEDSLEAFYARQYPQALEHESRSDGD